MDDEDCTFCSIAPERIAFSDAAGDGIWDAHPVNPGHILIVPRRHVPTWDKLTDVEKSRRQTVRVRKQHSLSSAMFGRQQPD
jgi:diadenosine tetraphosphate (Ap4A) HIT family hydrolase